MNKEKALNVSVLTLVIAISLIIAAVAVAFFVFLYYGGPAYNDWMYTNLPEDYAVVHMNSREIVLSRVNGSHGESVIRAYVTHFCHNDRYIGIKRINCDATGGLETPFEEVVWADVDLEYYLIDAQTGTLFGPYSETSFAQVCLAQQTGELSDWISTYPRPEGAH